MITLIIRFDGTNQMAKFDDLTVKELGGVLSIYGKSYYLVFETVRNIEAGVGCTIIIGAIEKG